MIIVICFVGIALTVLLLLEDIVRTIHAKKMVKSTIKRCFKALEEKEGRYNDR